MLQKSIQKNAFINFNKNLFCTLFPLLSFSYASRTIGPEYLGKIDFAISIISYFIMISSLGIDNYGTREVAKLRDEPVLLSQFVKELIVINLISTCFSYLLFIIIITFNSFLIPYRVLLYIEATSIIFTTLGVNWFFTGTENYLFIFKRTILFQLFSLIALLVFVRSKNDYLKYAFILVLSNVGSNLCNIYHIRKYLFLKTKISISLKRHLKPVFILFAMSIAVKVYTVLDTTMLGIIKGEYYVGIYSVATKINKTILFLIVAITSVFLPRLSYYITNDKKNFMKLLYKGVDFLLLVSLPCIAGLCILAKPIIILFSGEEYEIAYIPMRIMNPIILIIGLSNFIGVQIFMPLGKERYTLLSVICGALINFLLNLTLINKFGVLGASIATLVSESFVTLFQIIISRELLPWKSIILRFIKYLINTIIMCSFLIPISIYIHNCIVKVFVITITGIFIYLYLLIIQRNELVMNMFFNNKE